MGYFKEDKIKNKIKYYIKNNNNIEQKIEKATIEGNKITYQEKNIIVTLIKNNDKVTIIRENSEFKQIIEFIINKKRISEYYIKDMDISLEFTIYTKELLIKNNQIHIKYFIEETNNEYEYDIKVL